MSIQITTAHVQQYKGAVYHLTQQKGSKLRQGVRVETVVGKTGFYDQIGASSARKRTSRHSDTPRMDTPHSRRRVALESYDWADLIDNEDQIRMLMDPTSQYAEAAAMAMGRSMDDAIIAAALATAYTGEDGSSTTSYDSNMTVGVQTVWPGVSAADTGLNVAKLIAAGKNLGQNDVDPDEDRYIAVNARQISSILKDEKLSSNDYNILRPLVDGKVATYMGFTFLPTNRITTDGNGDDEVLYWAKGGILLGVGADISTQIDKRPDKNYATQVFCSMDIGATRMEEVRVGKILCDPGASPTTDV